MPESYIQTSFPFKQASEQNRIDHSPKICNGKNTIAFQDRPIHNWYRFVLSFPPHLVRAYIEDFGLDKSSTILDPFCGTGTTVIESKLHRLNAVGIEANPFPYFASSVKSDWGMEPNDLLRIAELIENRTYQELSLQKIDDYLPFDDKNLQLRELEPASAKAMIKNSISPIPLHKVLILLEQINKYKSSKSYEYCILGLGNALVSSIGNLRFGPEVGVGKIKSDVPVVSTWMQEIRKMSADLRSVYGQFHPDSVVHLADARSFSHLLEPNSIDAVITSPPYPNEKDYTRTTRLESVILGFFEDMMHLRGFKKTLLRSNTRGVYTVDDDDQWISGYEEIQGLAEEIEFRRIELGKTSGFEKLYARVTRLYFGGMVRHLTELQKVLRPNAKLAYVVGDQASYFQVMIRTGQLVAGIAERLGYEIERIDLFRTRLSTATRTHLREEVVVMRWPGK